jgi:hypothetical protein
MPESQCMCNEHTCIVPYLDYAGRIIEILIRTIAGFRGVVVEATIIRVPVASIKMMVHRPPLWNLAEMTLSTPNREVKFNYL